MSNAQYTNVNDVKRVKQTHNDKHWTRNTMAADMRRKLCWRRFETLDVVSTWTHVVEQHYVWFQDGLSSALGHLPGKEVVRYGCRVGVRRWFKQRVQWLPECSSVTLSIFNTPPKIRGAFMLKEESLGFNFEMPEVLISFVGWIS